MEGVMMHDSMGRYVILRKSLKSLLKNAGRRYDPELTHEKLEDLAERMLFKMLEGEKRV